MIYTIQNISAIIQGNVSGRGHSSISELLIDSRNVGNAQASLFFAIKGKQHDGHVYIADLYKKGVVSFVVSRLPSKLQEFQNATFILVKDTVNALHLLSSHHRALFQIPVVGVTGSNGKTIVKEWLYQLLRNDQNIARSPKSYNSQVGVPLSVWQLNEKHTFGLFEAGISEPNEMALLAPIIQPTIGLITNIGQAHAENFDSKEQKTAEKLKLFNNSETIIYCKDYAHIDHLIGLNKDFYNTKIFTWSKHKYATLQIQAIGKQDSSTTIQGVFNSETIEINVPFIDDASIENCIHCWTTLLYLGYENAVIAERINKLRPIAMRLELKEGVNNCSVINDSYNSDISSLAIALDFLNQQKQHENKTLVLSDILQSGQSDSSLYKLVANLIKEKGVTRFIGIGNALGRQAHFFDDTSLFYASTEDFLKNFDSSFFKDETILLKGARRFGFEQINKLIQQKAHQTVLEVNLNAIVNNLNYYRGILAPSTKVMAMVKAFSYGSGSFEIANILQYHRVDYLAVAYADEGVELRKAGITLPIMVMNPEQESFDAIVKYGLEPEIYSLRTLAQFEKALARMPYSLTKPISIHLKIDTGMHRLGFSKNEVDQLIENVKRNKTLHIQSVFSHLASSDNLEHDGFTRSQIAELMEVYDMIQRAFEYPIMKHVLNSSGISNYPDAQFDMVRIGIGLYGVGTNTEEQNQLEHVSTLKTSISQIKTVAANETVGYSLKGVLGRDSTIAIVPIGYADGLSRGLSNGKGKMLVNGAFAPIVGNICMDMCMIDVTGIDTEENDEVIVFGEEYSIRDMAKEVNTIPYEILTNVSRRVKRVYYQE